MRYQAMYRDQNNRLVTEVLTSNYDEAWHHCVSKTFDSPTKEFLLVEMNTTDVANDAMYSRSEAA